MSVCCQLSFSPVRDATRMFQVHPIAASGISFLLLLLLPDPQPQFHLGRISNLEIHLNSTQIQSTVTKVQVIHVIGLGSGKHFAIVRLRQSATSLTTRSPSKAVQPTTYHLVNLTILLRHSLPPLRHSFALETPGKETILLFDRAWPGPGLLR